MFQRYISIKVDGLTSKKINFERRKWRSVKCQENRKPARQYTPEYKTEAARLMQKNGNGQVLIELGVPTSTISHWVLAVRIDAIDTGTGPQKDDTGGEYSETSSREQSANKKESKA